ncbi:MAG: xanthine dehydrogenase family protein subunit M [Woeseiaceae bacterium]
MAMYDFNYHRPANLAEAGTILAGCDDPKILAGGMTLLPTMKFRLARPSDIVDIGGIDELQGIRDCGDRLEIGALTRHADVAASDIVRSGIPALAALAGRIGDPQVRNRGTIGGSIANNDPAADYPAAALALDAIIKTSRREIAADRFFTGMFETALEPNELVVAISFARPKRAAYAKHPNPASRYAIAGVMVAELKEGIRVAVTGAGPCVFRATGIEEALAKDFRESALDGASLDATDLNSDMHASAEYRAHMVLVMARRAVTAASG